MTNKIYNFLMVSFLTFGTYNLPGCNPNPEDPKSTEGNESTGRQEQICGDGQIINTEECDVFNYESIVKLSRCADTKWPAGGEFGPCIIAWDIIPQLDCSVNWIGVEGCGQEEADLLCKLYTRNEKAVSTETNWIIDPTPVVARPILLQSEILDKNGFKLKQVPKSEYFGEIWTYDVLPFDPNQSLPVLTTTQCVINP